METLLILLHQCQSRLNDIGVDAGDFLAGIFTLGGAALGAYLGGKVAFRGTIKANNQALTRSKLEEAFSALAEVTTVRTDQMVLVRDMLKNTDAIEVRRYAKEELEIHNHLPAASRLSALTNFYLPSAEQQVFELSGIQFLFDRFVRDLDENQGREAQASQHANEQLLEFYKLSGRLKEVIRQAHAELG
ncbi:hypothetical protein K1Y77_08825 [Halomonas qaidamensis]|uniref:Uncharacterized protein n=1 Tax=Halomonas qaidamensis TaxID=2866211 RepID=A0ABY6JJV7_9GAMM|nr:MULTISPECIES: hypothetical protein [Halomonas]UYV17613.1 hypothetical protein K1Y77_08825 [Halomonas qaidamensis]